LVWPLYLVGLLCTFALGTRVLVVPLQAADLHASAATIGLLYAAYAAVGAVVSIPAGLLIDRRGSRAVLVGALAVTAAGQLLASAGSIPLLFVSQVLAGVGWGAVPLGTVTAAMAISRPERMGGVIGYSSLGNQTGLMAGPALAGVLVGPLGTAWVLALTAACPLLAVGIALAMLRREPRPVRAGSWWGSSREVLARPGMLPVALLAASIGIVWGSFQAYFAVTATRGLGLPASWTGWLIGIAGLANTLSRIPASRLLDRTRARGVLVAAAVTGFGVAMTALPHLRGFLPVTALLVASVPLIGVAIMGMTISAAQLGGATGRGRAIAVTSAVLSLSGGLAPALVAPAMDSSYALGYALVGAAGATTACVALVFRQRVIRRAAAPAR
jgi:predicted MFS family arabinose efflux permease